MQRHIHHCAASQPCLYVVQAAQPKVSEGPADAASASALQGILPIAAGEPIPSAEAELPSVLPQVTRIATTPHRSREAYC